MKKVSGDPVEKKTSKSLAPVFIALTMGGLIVVVVGTMIGWNFFNRKWVRHTFKADIEFIQAPETVQSGRPSRFIVQVEGEKGEKADKPLPGRVMYVQVTPPHKAQIISVSGPKGEHHPALAANARGQTDSLGKVEILIRAEDIGKYTLVATDSASNLEGTVNFQVSRAEAE